MPISLQALLQQTAISTFEQVAFLLLDPVGAGACATSAVERRVDFEGPVSGRLMLRVDGGVLPHIAENMLGCGSAHARTVQLDALGELANIICGNVVPALGDESALYRLTVRPVTTAAADEAGVAAATAHFDVNGAFVECVLYTAAGAS